MVDMGMTDKQFNGFVRFLLDALKDAMEEKENDKKTKSLPKLRITCRKRWKIKRIKIEYRSIPSGNNKRVGHGRC